MAITPSIFVGRKVFKVYIRLLVGEVCSPAVLWCGVVQCLQSAPPSTHIEVIRMTSNGRCLGVSGVGTPIFEWQKNGRVVLQICQTVSLLSENDIC